MLWLFLGVAILAAVVSGYLLLFSLVRKKKKLALYGLVAGFIFVLISIFLAFMVFVWGKNALREKLSENAKSRFFEKKLSLPKGCFQTVKDFEPIIPIIDSPIGYYHVKICKGMGRIFEKNRELKSTLLDSNSLDIPIKGSRPNWFLPEKKLGSKVRFYFRPGKVGECNTYIYIDWNYTEAYIMDPC